MPLDLVFVGLPENAQNDWALISDQLGVRSWFIDRSEIAVRLPYEGHDILITPFSGGRPFQELCHQYQAAGGSDLSVAIVHAESFLLCRQALLAGANDVISAPPTQAGIEGLIENLKVMSARKVHPDAILPLELVEKMAIQTALKACNGQVSMTSRKLGIGRSTLYRKLEQYELNLANA